MNSGDRLKAWTAPRLRRLPITPELLLTLGRAGFDERAAPPMEAKRAARR